VYRKKELNIEKIMHKKVCKEKHISSYKFVY